MAEIDREQRKELARRARQIYRARKHSGDQPPQIAAAIAEQLPQLLPLEVLRLARNWSRAEAIDRLAKLYAERGLPPPRVTEAMLCKWEHGTRRMSAEYEHMLCRLYEVEREQLRHGITGPDHYVEGDDPMKRRTLLAASIPVGLVLAFDDALDVPPNTDRPEDVTQIRRRLQDARRQWNASALTTLMATLPDTLAVAREAAERIDTPAAWALAAAVHDIATDTLNKVGRKQSARITADRSVMLSARSEDPVAMAASARALGMMLRTTGRFGSAARVVEGAASRLEAAGLRTPGQVAMYVRLMCTSAYTMAGAGDRPRALERLGEAERAARRLPPPQASMALPFVWLYRVNIENVLGDPGAGLEATKRLQEGMYPTAERKARLWTDVARVAWPSGQVEQVVHALLAAHAHAPAEVRDRPRIHAIAAELVERHPKVAGAPELAAAIRHRHT